MQGSPIKDLDGRSSRLEQELLRKINPDSPTRYDLDFYQRKINRLENQLTQVQDELTLNRHKLRKFQDYQIKYELLLKQNQSCLAENERLSTDFQQQRLANQNLREKLDLAKGRERDLTEQMTQLNKDYEKMKLKNKEIFNNKSDETSSIKEQMEVQTKRMLDIAKAEAKDVEERLENDLRKANKHLEQSKSQVFFLQNKLNKYRADKEEEAARLKGQRAQLKNQLVQVQTYLHEQMNKMRREFLEIQGKDLSTLNETLERTTEVLTRDLKVLKDLLDFKNRQIDLLLEEDLREKRDHEQRVKGLIKEIYQLKSKHEQMQKTSEIELFNLKERLLALQAEEEDKIKKQVQIMRRNYEQEIEQLKLQLGLREEELIAKDKDYARKHNKHANDMQQRLGRIRELQGSMVDLQSRNNRELDNLRGTMTKLQLESQGNMMQKVSTIQFLEQQIKELNIHIEQKNNEISLLINQMDQLKIRHASVITKLIASKDSQRLILTKEISDQKGQIEELEIALHEALATVRQLQSRLQANKINFQSQRRTYDYVIRLLKNQQLKLMQFAKQVDSKLLSERTKVGDGIAQKNVLDLERTTQLQKLKQQTERLIFTERERMKKELQGEKNRVRQELAKAQKERDDIKRAYEEVVGRTGQSGSGGGITDYQRKMAVLDGQIGLTQNLLKAINTVLNQE